MHCSMFHPRPVDPYPSLECASLLALCGHVFCRDCVVKATSDLGDTKKLICPICAKDSSLTDMRAVQVEDEPVGAEDLIYMLWDLQRRQEIFDKDAQELEDALVKEEHRLREEHERIMALSERVDILNADFEEQGREITKLLNHEPPKRRIQPARECKSRRGGSA
ncbi:hypothetical protein PLICRDRAFT_174270 [Plicaturopsis crispa FD-325 SS-3]|nr:hypothetical protein PLICRDRAFT_174270 [Plicaturopsis crispa FD-325 SS-3]